MSLFVSLVSPVYGAGAIPMLHRRLAAMADRHPDVRFEFIFVDDASPDDSWVVLQRAAAHDPRVIALRLRTNVRQVRAIFAGTSVASGDVIVVMDSDLEDPPEAVSDLIAAHRQGHDLVVVARARQRRPFAREVGSGLMNLAGRAAGVPSGDIGSSFLLMSRDIERGVREQLERTGIQLLLPTNYAYAHRPTSITVATQTRVPSQYPSTALVRMGVGFFRVYLAPRIGRWLVTGGAAVAASSVAKARAGRPWAARAAVAAGAIGLGATWSSSEHRDLRDRSIPLYEIAERTGGPLLEQGAVPAAPEPRSAADPA